MVLKCNLLMATISIKSGIADLKQILRQLSVRAIFTALIAAIYAVMTISLGSFGYSIVQIRLGEALTPLPFLMGFPAVVGLTIGCIIANLVSPVGLIDVLLGSLFTFIAAIFSWKLSFGKKILACVYPVIVNAFGVSIYLSIFYGVSYFVSVIAILIGESIAALVVGYPLLIAIEKIQNKQN
jgi:uncharacterized membrane protein